MKTNEYLFVLLFFLIAQTLFSQEDAFTNEVTYQGEKVYYNGKPLSGWLFSEEDGINNECDCTLKAKYKNGLLHGSKKEWYKSGKLKETAVYFHGEISSKIKYYPNGNIRKKEQFQNGKIVSSVLYNKDGSLKNKPQTQQINPKKPSNYQVAKPASTQNAQKPTTTQPQYQALEQATYSHPTAYNGLLKIYYPNGKVKRVTFHKDGMLVKDSIFYDTGKLNYTKKFSDGELVHQEKYSKDNHLLIEVNFTNNKKHGIQRKNYSNGKPEVIEEYNNGDLTHYEKYYENGKLKVEENYKFNKKHGNHKRFDETGNLIYLIVYDMDEIIRQESYENGIKKVITQLNDLSEIKEYKNNQLIQLKYLNKTTNKKDSIWIKYDANTGYKLSETAYINGKKTREGQYLNNKKDGTWIYYAQNQEKETKEEYKNGNKISSVTLTYAKQIKNLS